MKEEAKTTWSVLSAINCNEHVEKKKSGSTELKYLSWAWAWGILKENYPDASYTVREWDGKPYLYDPSLGYLVEVSLTVDGVTQTMRLPVMDGANKAQKAEPYEYVVKNTNFKFATYDADKGCYIDKFGNVQEEYLTKRVEAATMFDINTAIMRCLVKAMALFGLGHYIYAGEDLPQSEIEAEKEFQERVAKAVADMGKCKTLDEIEALFNENKDLENVKVFRAAINRRAAELGVDKKKNNPNINQ